MISRRSGGDADYVAGVRAFLNDEEEPLQETTVHSGYGDAHDMCAHISEIAADLWADAIEEEEKFAQYRSSVANCSPADWDSSESKLPPEETAARRRSAEIDTKLDRFIAEHPKLFEYYQRLSKEELIRTLMLGRMRRSEYIGRNAETHTWVEEHPGIDEKIDHRIGSVSQQSRERGLMNAAKAETMRHNGNEIRP